MIFKNLVIGVIMLLLEITTVITLLLFSHYVVSNSLGSHGSQSTRFPCPSLSPGICSNSCPLSQWCYLAITSSVTLFFFCPQSFPAFPQSFLMSQHLTSGGQSIGVSASVLPMNIQGCRSSWHHFIWAPSPLLITAGMSIPLLCLEGVPDLHGAPQDEASLTKKFET